MTVPIQAIIFDFGGVLLEWDPHALYRRFIDQPQQIDQFLAEVGFATWNAEQDRGRPFAEGIAALSSQFPHHAHLIRAYYDHWEDSIVGPISGTVDILRKLKLAGYPLYGLSNWSAETFPRACKQYTFFDLLDDIVLSGDVKMLKPDPAIFNLLLHRIGYPAHNCLLIDDSQPNIATANSLGFNTIHFKSPVQLQAELKRFQLLK
ncbi:MAG: HAD family phosphatase [Anaerolineales bacterium]|nr:HAD family phosphatase [Anaerolineales bacterium]